MNQEEVVLCGSSAYTKKYYLNPDFQKIPQGIQDELKLMCVLYTEDVGGTLTLKFDEDGDLVFETAGSAVRRDWKCSEDETVAEHKAGIVRITGNVL